MTQEDIRNIEFKPTKYANQKSVYTNKSSDGTYGIIRVGDNIEAVRNLKNEGQAYALWVYFNCNQDGYIEAFSPQHIANLWDMDVKTVRRAFAALERHGYLEDIGQNHYIFYESLLDNTNMDNLVHPTWTKLSTSMDKVVHSNTTYNTYNNTIDNTWFSSHDKTAKASNHFEENLSHGESVITKCNNETCDTGATDFVYTSRIDGENDNLDNSVHVDKVVHVLDKDELRPIHTSDGIVVELPIRNILDGLSDALTNQKNEDVLKEISERCDITSEQRNEIEDTIELWRLGF